MNLRKKILNKLHPILKPLSQWYLSKTRLYRYGNILIKVYPGVFHPGFFFSTKVLLSYLKTETLQGLQVLELGAGSGLISIYCAKQGAIVTASDISEKTTAYLYENKEINNAPIQIVLSDLFDRINPSDFDLIIINPPYYPKDPLSEKDFAWFCGSNFDYFSRLFQQLKSMANPEVKSIMVLSEDCNIKHIETLAKQNGLSLNIIFQKRAAGEINYIFRIMAG